MKVSGNNGVNILKIYNENKPKSTAGSEGPGKKYDTVEISGEGLKVAKYAVIAKSIPDVRMEKVKEVKTAITNGTYKVSAGDLASKIMEAIKEGK
jgi:flagellar biosynthesis anti-sigma factor FlgM